MDRHHDFDACRRRCVSGAGGHGLNRRTFLAAGTAAAASSLVPGAALAQAARDRHGIETRFERIPTQFIAALGANDATAGDNAQSWGLWRVDPGPRGVRLANYEQLQATGVAPAGWRFDGSGWWLEEHGLIMEAPEFPLPAGQYMVTGNRSAKSVLTVHAPDENGARRWELADGATLYDVTHLRCRSALYTPAAGAGSCTPAAANQGAFPVRPGAPMPPVEGCNKQDYAVLIVIGVAVDSAV